MIMIVRMLQRNHLHLNRRGARVGGGRGRHDDVQLILLRGFAFLCHRPGRSGMGLTRRCRGMEQIGLHTNKAYSHCASLSFSTVTLSDEWEPLGDGNLVDRGIGLRTLNISLFLM